MMASTYIQANRARKVVALLAVINEIGLAANELRFADEDTWRRLAHEAGVMALSAEERRQVVERMDATEADLKAEAAWQDAQMQETGSDRCPTRE